MSADMHQPFRVMAQGQNDHTLEAFQISSKEFGVMLTIATPDAAVYVTREQAAKFFGFSTELMSDRVDALVLENQSLQDRVDELTEANLRLALQLPGVVKTAVLSEPRTYGLEGPDGKGYPYG